MYTWHLSRRARMTGPAALRSWLQLQALDVAIYVHSAHMIAALAGTLGTLTLQSAV